MGDLNLSEPKTTTPKTVPSCSTPHGNSWDTKSGTGEPKLKSDVICSKCEHPIRDGFCGLNCDGKAEGITVHYCPNCHSPNLAKIKGCIRCLDCHFKEDCYGW